MIKFEIIHCHFRVRTWPPCTIFTPLCCFSVQLSEEMLFLPLPFSLLRQNSQMSVTGPASQSLKEVLKVLVTHFPCVSVSSALQLSHMKRHQAFSRTGRIAVHYLFKILLILRQQLSRSRSNGANPSASYWSKSVPHYCLSCHRVLYSRPSLKRQNTRVEGLGFLSFLDLHIAHHAGLEELDTGNT